MAINARVKIGAYPPIQIITDSFRFAKSELFLKSLNGIVKNHGIAWKNAS
jgi:hypothetical protein